MVEQNSNADKTPEKQGLNKSVQSIHTPEKESATKKSVENSPLSKSASPSPGKKSFLQNMIENMSPGRNETAEAN